MKLLDMTQKYGSATYDYPFEPYVVHDGFRGKPEYDYDKCIGCTACGVACPSNAINVKLNKNRDKLVWEFDCARCIFCGRCDEVCPTNAVMLSKEFEMAVRLNKDSLIIRGELELQYCEECGKPFTTKRLIAYCLENFKRVGWKKDDLEKKAKYIRVCPSCKKTQTIEHYVQEFRRSQL